MHLLRSVLSRDLKKYLFEKIRKNPQWLEPQFVIVLLANYGLAPTKNHNQGTFKNRPKAQVCGAADMLI